jgi:hypothetical protein
MSDNYTLKDAYDIFGGVDDTPNIPDTPDTDSTFDSGSYTLEQGYDVFGLSPSAILEEEAEESFEDVYIPIEDVPDQTPPMLDMENLASLEAEEQMSFERDYTPGPAPQEPVVQPEQQPTVQPVAAKVQEPASIDEYRQNLLGQMVDPNLDDVSKELLIEEFASSVIREALLEPGYRPYDQILDREMADREKEFAVSTTAHPRAAKRKQRELQGLKFIPDVDFSYGSLDPEENRKKYGFEVLSRELRRSDLTAKQKELAFKKYNENVDLKNPVSDAEKILLKWIYDPSKIKGDEIGAESLGGDVAKLLSYPLNIGSGLIGLIASSAAAPVSNQRYYQQGEKPLDPRSNHIFVQEAANIILDWNASGLENQQDPLVIAKTYMDTGSSTLNDTFFKKATEISQRGRRLETEDGPGVPFYSPAEVFSILKSINEDKVSLKKQLEKMIFADPKSKFFTGNLSTTNEIIGYMQDTRISKEFQETVDKTFKVYSSILFSGNDLYRKLKVPEQRYADVFASYFPKETAATQVLDTVLRAEQYFDSISPDDTQDIEEYDRDPSFLSAAYREFVDVDKDAADELLSVVPEETRERVFKVLAGKEVLASAFGLSEDLSIAPVVLNAQQRRDLLNRVIIQYTQKQEIEKIQEMAKNGDLGEKWTGNNIKGTPEEIKERKEILHTVAPQLLMVESMMTNPTFANTMESYYNNLAYSAAETPFQLTAVFAFADALAGTELFPKKYQDVAIELWKRDPALMIANAAAVTSMGAKLVKKGLRSKLSFKDEDFKTSPIDEVDTAFSESSPDDGSMTPRQTLTMVSDEGSMTPILVTEDIVGATANEKIRGSVVKSPKETIGQYQYEIQRIDRDIATEMAAPENQRNQAAIDDLSLQKEANIKLKTAREQYRTQKAVGFTGEDNSIEVPVSSVSKETMDEFDRAMVSTPLSEVQKLSSLPQKKKAQALERGIKNTLDNLDELAKKDFDQAFEDAVVGREKAYGIASNYDIPNFMGPNLERMVKALTIELVDDYRVWKYVLEEGGENPYIKSDNAEVAKIIANIREKKLYNAEQARRTAIQQIDDPNQKVKVVYTNEPLRSARGDRNVAARTDRKKNRILLNRAEIERTFKEKAWSKAKVRGVRAFPEDAFKTLDQWERFLIAHERVHFTPENYKLKRGPERENHANQIAYNQVMDQDDLSAVNPLGLHEWPKEDYVGWIKARIEEWEMSEQASDFPEISQSVAEQSARQAFGIPEEVSIQIPFTRESGEAVMNKLAEQGVQDFAKYLAVYTNSEFPIGSQIATPKNIVGENISSRGKSALSRDLTNLGNNIGLEYKGRKYRNSEHAYQTWKSGSFDETAYNSKAKKPRGKLKVNKEKSFDIMVDIITEKFLQNEKLYRDTVRAGGSEYIKKSTHKVTGKDKFWESSGGPGENLPPGIELVNGEYFKITVDPETGKRWRSKVSENMVFRGLLDETTDAPRDKGKFIQALYEAFIAADERFERREQAKQVLLQAGVPISEVNDFVLLMERTGKATKNADEVAVDPISGKKLDSNQLLDLMNEERRAEAIGDFDRPDAVDISRITQEAKSNLLMTESLDDSPRITDAEYQRYLQKFETERKPDYDPIEDYDPADYDPADRPESKEFLQLKLDDMVKDALRPDNREIMGREYLEFPGKDSEEFSRRRYSNAETDDYLLKVRKTQEFVEKRGVKEDDLMYADGILDGRLLLPDEMLLEDSPKYVDVVAEYMHKGLMAQIETQGLPKYNITKMNKDRLRPPKYYGEDFDSRGPISVISEATRKDPSFVYDRFDSLAIADELALSNADPDLYLGLNLSAKEIMEFVETGKRNAKSAAIVKRLTSGDESEAKTVKKGPYQGAFRTRTENELALVKSPKAIYGTERMPLSKRVKRTFLRTMFGDNIFALDKAYARTKQKRYIAYAAADALSRPFAIINLPEYVRNAREEAMLHLYSDPNPTTLKTNMLRMLDFFSTDSQVIGLKDFYSTRLFEGSAGFKIKQVLDSIPLTDEFEVTPRLLKKYFDEIDSLENSGKLRTFDSLDLHQIGSVIQRMSDAKITDRATGKKYKFSDYAEIRVDATKFFKAQNEILQKRLDKLTVDQNKNDGSLRFATLAQEVEEKRYLVQEQIFKNEEKIKRVHVPIEELGLDVNEKKASLERMNQRLFSGEVKRLPVPKRDEFFKRKKQLEEEISMVVRFDNQKLIETIKNPKYFPKVPLSDLDDFQRSTFVLANEWVKPRRDAVFDAAVQIITGEDTVRLLFTESEGFKNNVVREMPDGTIRVVERFEPTAKGEVQASGYAKGSKVDISEAVAADRTIPGVVKTVSDDELAQAAYLKGRSGIGGKLKLPTPTKSVRLFDPDPMNLLQQTLSYMSDYFDTKKVVNFLESELQNAPTGNLATSQVRINRAAINVLTATEGGVRLIEKNGGSIQKAIRNVLEMTPEEQAKFLGKSLTTDERFFFEKSFEKAFTSDQLLRMYADYQGSIQKTIVGLHNTINTLKFQNHLQKRGLILNRSEYNLLPSGVKSQFIDVEKVKTKKGERVLPTTLDGAYINKRVSRYFQRQTNLQEAVRQATGFSRWFDRAQQFTKTGLVIDVINNSIARNLYSAVFVQGMLQADTPVNPKYYVRAAKTIRRLAQGKEVNDPRIIRIIKSFSTDTSIKRDIKYTRGVQLMNEMIESFYQYAEDTKAVERVEKGEAVSSQQMRESLIKNLSLDEMGMQEKVDTFLSNLKTENIDQEVKNQLNPSQARKVLNNTGIAIDTLISFQTHPDLIAKVAYALQLEEAGAKPNLAYAESLRTFVDYVDVPRYLNFLRFGGSGNPIAGFFGVLTSDFITFSAAQTKNFWNTVTNNPVRSAIFGNVAFANDKSLEETLKLKRTIAELRSLKGDPTLQLLPGYTLQEAVGSEYGKDRGGFMGGALSYSGSLISGQTLPANILGAIPVDPQALLSKMPADFKDWTFDDTVDAVVDVLLQQSGGTGNQAFEALVKTPSQQKKDAIARNKMIELGWIEGDETPVVNTSGPGGFFRALATRFVPRIVRSTVSLFDGSKRRDQIVGQMLGFSVEPIDYKQFSAYRTFPVKLYNRLEDDYKQIEKSFQRGEQIDSIAQQKILDKLESIKFKALQGKSGLEAEQQYMFLYNELKLLAKLAAGEITYEQLKKFRILGPVN